MWSNISARKPLAVMLAGATALIATACGDNADNNADASGEVCESFSGETVTLVVPFSPGGGYDSYARLVAPELGEILDAQVVVENRPGAGGLVAINELTNASADGTHIAIMNGPGTASAILAEAEGADFGLDDLSFIGRVADNDIAVVTSEHSGIESWDEVDEQTDFRFGSAGRGSSDYITAALLIDMFDLSEEEIVIGFSTQSEVELALLQGNVEGIAGPIDSRLPGIQAGEQIPLLAIASERSDYIPDTPLLTELDLTDDQLMLAEAHETVNEIGRPLVGPGDMDEDALECLRQSMTTIAEDEDFLQKAEEQGRPLNHIDGATMENDLSLTREDLPEEYVELLENSF